METEKEFLNKELDEEQIARERKKKKEASKKYRENLKKVENKAKLILYKKNALKRANKSREIKKIKKYLLEGNLAEIKKLNSSFYTQIQLQRNKNLHSILSSLDTTYEVEKNSSLTSQQNDKHIGDNQASSFFERKKSTSKKHKGNLCLPPPICQNLNIEKLKECVNGLEEFLNANPTKMKGFKR